MPSFEPLSCSTSADIKRENDPSRICLSPSLPLPLPLRLILLTLPAPNSPIHRIYFSSSTSKRPYFRSQLSPPSTLRLPSLLPLKVFLFLVFLHSLSSTNDIVSASQLFATKKGPSLNNVVHPRSHFQPLQEVRRRLLRHLYAGREPISHLPHCPFFRQALSLRQ